MTTRDISSHIEEVYPFVFMDAIHYNVRGNGMVVKKAVYMVLAYTMDGHKDVLGMYVGENESLTATFTCVKFNQ